MHISKNFAKKGEKSGWTYIEIPGDIANQIFPGNKKPFRVKGKLDNLTIKQSTLMPMGKGIFIMPLNREIRNALKKESGNELNVKLELDTSEVLLSSELLEFLEEEPTALENFRKLSHSNQKYYSNWILSAKSFETKFERFAMSINALLRGMHYGEMIGEQKNRTT